MSTILIDADIHMYRAISAAQSEVEWEEDVWAIQCDLKEAMIQFEGMISAVTDNGENAAKLCFSDRTGRNFRKELVDPTYKSNRVTKKPVGFKPFRDKLFDTFAWQIVCKPALEADDVIGILATKPGADFIISSADKDLKTIPGKHLVDGAIIEISPEEAIRFFYTQVLTGDPVDGYKGLPGCGPVKAGSILSKEGEPWANIVDAYVKAGFTEEDALRQARMARILQWNDWDQQKQEPVLWNPSA